MPRWAVGVDLSLTSTGIAAVDIDSGASFTQAVTSTGKKTDTIIMHAERIQDLCDRIIDTIELARPEIVVVESAMFSTRNDSSAHRRAGLWWVVVLALHTAGLPVAVLSPSEVKKFGTGKGNASKDAMVARAATVWGEELLSGSGNDKADALFLATAGAFALGGQVVLKPTEFRREVGMRVAAQLE